MSTEHNKLSYLRTHSEFEEFKKSEYKKFDKSKFKIDQ